MKGTSGLSGRCFESYKWWLNIHTNHHIRDSVPDCSQGEAFLMAPAWWSRPHADTPSFDWERVWSLGWHQSSHTEFWWTDFSWSFHWSVFSLPPYYPLCPLNNPHPLLLPPSFLLFFFPFFFAFYFFKLEPTTQREWAWMFFRTNDMNARIENMDSDTMSRGVFVFICHVELL